MKELEPILTKQTQNTYSRGGDIFMVGEGNGVGSIERAVPRAQRTPERSVVTPEKIQAARKSWAEHYAQKGIDFNDPKNPLMADERGTVEMAIGFGYSPETVTSKGAREVKAKDVVANSLLSREDRLKKAKEILGIEKFDEDEEKAKTIGEAIIKAHEVGGEKGKDESKRAGVYNYTREQLAEKARILEEAGFGKEQRRALIEAGIAAFPIGGEDFDEIDTASMTNPVVIRNADFLNDLLRNGKLTEEKLTGAREAILKVTRDNERMTPAEYLLYAPVLQWIDRAEGALVRKERGRGELRNRAFYLSQEVNNFFNSLGGRGEDDSSLTPGELAKKKEYYRKTADFLKETPTTQTNSFPSEILDAVRHFKELREELICEILFWPYKEKTETDRYTINLYADSNLFGLLGNLDKDDHERFEYFYGLKTAAEHFHSMNAGILTGNFENFQRIAENINYQHFEGMKQIPGADLVMRLYEQKYNEYTAKKGWISDADYKILKNEVEDTFREMNKAGLTKSAYGLNRSRLEEEAGTPWKLKNWEEEMALGVGRTFFNITLRGAEKIAVGHFPDKTRQQFAGFPQEDMVRVMNWREWLLKRFKFAEGKHGLEFLDMTAFRYYQFLDYKGRKLGINRIKKIGGAEVNVMELAGQFKTSGIYSGWRLENMVHKRIYLRDGSGTIQDYTDGLKRDGSGYDLFMKGITARRKANPGKSDAKLITRRDQEDYLEFYSALIDNLDIGLGTLIKIGPGAEGKLAYLAREAVWKKVSEKNLPLMIEYLRNIDYEDPEKMMEKAEELIKDPTRKEEGEEMMKKAKKMIREEGEVGAPERARTLKQIGEEMGGVWANLESSDWINLKLKILKRHEIAVKRGALNRGDIAELARLDEIERNLDRNEESRYSAEEMRLLERIKQEGKKLAPDLADIEFPYTPFMNDIPFGELDYTDPGQTFYKRRTGGDLGGYHKGQQSFQKLANNPGGMGVKAALETMVELVEGISGPEGDIFAREANLANLEAFVDVVMTTPGGRQALYKEIMEMTRQGTSIAQKWAGMHVESITEFELANFIEDAIKAGVISPELGNYIKRKKHATFKFLLWAIFRDVLYLTPAIAGVSLASQLTKK